MTNNIRVIFCLLTLGVLSMPGVAASSRLAIVDRSGNPVLSELLFAELSGLQGVELVERQEIERVVGEQDLSLSGDVRSDSLLRYGQLLGADAILLLKRERQREGDHAIRVRLLNTRHGFKLFDRLIDAGSATSAYEDQAKLLAQYTLQNLQRVNLSIAELRPISVSTFRCEELSSRWDWLSDTMPSSIERNLSLSAGVVIMERQAVTPLLGERRLSAQFPESLQAAAVLVDGTCRIDSDKQLISVSVRARQAGETVLTFQIDGSLDAIGELCARIAERLLMRNAADGKLPTMKRSSEAQALAAEARVYISRKEAARAIPPAESAHALMPRSIEYQKLLLDSLVRGGLRMGIESRAYPADAEKTCLRAMSLIEKIVRAQPILPGDALRARETHFKEIDDALNDACNFLYRSARNQRHSDCREVCVAQFWNICRFCCEQYAGKSDRLHRRVLYHASRGLHFTPDVDKAIQIATWVLKDEMRLGTKPAAIATLVNAAELHWKGDRDALVKVGRYFASLGELKDPSVRLEVLEQSIRFFFVADPNHEKMRRCAREYVSLSKILRRPSVSPIKHRTFAATKAESEAFEAELLADVLAFAHENRLVKSGTDSWVGGAIRLADILARNGRPEDAAVQLERMMALFASNKSHKWQKLRGKLHALQQEHPDLKLVKPPDVALGCKALLVLGTDNTLVRKGRTHTNIRFRRMVFDEGSLVVVYSIGDCYGVVRLDGAGERAVSIQESATALRLQTNKGWLSREHQRGPSVAASHGDIYLGFVDAGLLVFRSGGKIEQLNEETGLAYNRIRHLECVGEKLFAIVGAVTEDSGLMEIDMPTGNSRLLTSTKSEDASFDINGRTISGIARDAEGRKLWVLSTDNTWKDGAPWRRVYTYDPEVAQFERIKSDPLDQFLVSVQSIDTANGLRSCGDSILVWGGKGLYQLDPRTEDGLTLFSPGDSGKWQFPREFNSRHNVLTQRGLASEVFGQLAAFTHGARKPELIPNELFPGADDGELGVRDLIATKQGLYVLTDQALYLMPELPCPSRDHMVVKSERMAAK